MKTFQDFICDRHGNGGFSTEDALACLLPLFKQVVATHKAGFVAPLDGIGKLLVEDGHAFFVESDHRDTALNNASIYRILQKNRGAVDVVSQQKQIVYVDSGNEDSLGNIVGSDESNVESMDVVGRESRFQHPVFVPGYICWEQMLEHHDPLTDIFNLGQILASVTLGLDFNDPQDVRKFVEHRRNLFAINKDIHPVIARAIVRMTELDRSQRVQELPLLVRALENYRLQDVEVSVEPDDIEGFESRDLQGKQQVLLDRLQKRLFEISRRNRMLHFRQTMQSVNLTQASVPLSFDYKNVRDDQILICNKELEKRIAAGKSIPLNKHLNFSEAIYLPPLLNRIARESRRDMAEFGFEQLRIVMCMLHWSNLKQKPHERYSSPLVLVPARLKKKKGVRDTWELEPLGNDAEVNPVVRYLFKQLYDIQLPERIDLDTAGLDSLFEFMQSAIAKSEPAVELKKIARPRIQLLHASARKKLENYRRRARVSGRGIRTFQEIDYSYDPANYHPLGVKIFSQYLRPTRTTLAEIVKTAPQPRHYFAETAGSGTSDDNSGIDGNAEKEVTIKEQTFFDMKKDDGANPYDWSFDLCSVTLANFRYRKMSLVRDYETLVTETRSNPAFEAAFSLIPRDVSGDMPQTPPLTDRFDVVPCDPTQATSIAQARAGASYIVQGPPGTGKSQTITNLIADFAARGKRVLFVCEKRAAIDVVFARLRKCGLGDLCCLIHDSQGDKKSFVMDLKETYEGFLKEKPKYRKTETERNARVTQVLSALKPLQDYSESMKEVTYRAGVSTHQMVQQCISLSEKAPALNEIEQEQLPSWMEWQEGRDSIETMLTLLRQQEPSGILARHPLRNLDAGLSGDERPMQTLEDGLKESQSLVEKIFAELNQMPNPILDLEFHKLCELINWCSEMAPLIQSGSLVLLDENNQASRDLKEALEDLHVKRKTLESVREQNANWQERIAKRDLQAAIDSANHLSSKWIPIARPAWWRLRKVMNRSYNFDAHPVKPGWVAVLTGLQEEYAADDQVEKQMEVIGKQFNLSVDTYSQLKLIEQARLDSREFSEWKTEIVNLFSSDASQGETAKTLLVQEPNVSKLRATLSQFLDQFETLKFPDLICELDMISQNKQQLPDYLSCLDQLKHVPEGAKTALRKMNLKPEQIEVATAHRTLTMIQRDDRKFERFDQTNRSSQLEKLEEAYDLWMDVNSKFIKQKTQAGFLEHVQQADTGDEQQEFCKRYNKGRKILEHEFGKQMRYKSIRDMVSGDSGMVVRDLKPVWLMSPLSVSDTLPLGDQDFDVVIFDEASQITLESSIPSLFRAVQAIVVGDEQQLPPTDFFSAKKDRESEEEVTFEHEGETISYDLESNSLLNHAGRNMSSTMLGWHYRSRDEALISFSNWAFYHGRLLTIPEESVLAPGLPKLTARDSSCAGRNVESMFARPVTFHLMEHGVYLKRRNRAEAEYIASMIRELLLKQDGRTIGVIAFSEAQQDEIERAIDRLARLDSEFSSLLEAELVREDDGQFVGLLVKNLENIQGDERDIIILSVCYGPDDNGRMIMNFGPINKSGGEKRLNVAFSRAKHHMAIVSTILYSSITNEYNIGANCLRNYLRYADAISSGDAQSAGTILHGLSPWQERIEVVKEVPSALTAIGNEFEKHGLMVDYHIGNSSFKCDLGLRKAGDTKYRLGILVDAGDYYESDVELIDRELFRPRLLSIFGWDTYSILLKDWLDDPDRIIEDVLNVCEERDVNIEPSQSVVETSEQFGSAPQAEPEKSDDVKQDMQDD